MGISYNTSIVRDGLVLHLDAANVKSYPGTGSSISDISGMNETAIVSNFELVSSPHTGFHLFDGGGRVNVSTISNITTVELWFYQNRNDNGARYLLDMRTGGSGGWIYSSSSGSNWSSGVMYINGEHVDSPPNLNVIESYSVGNYCQVVVIANSPATDDINLFSRYTDTESLDVNFYNAKVYNRPLNQEEVKQNFNALRGRYGI